MYNMLFLVIVNGVIVKVYLCGWLLNILFKVYMTEFFLFAW